MNKMHEIQKPTVDRLINDVIKTENIQNAKVKFTFPEGRKGFVAHIAKVEIAGSNKTLHVIVKYPSTLDDFREKIYGRELYCLEIRFYTEFVPLFQNLQEQYGAKEPFNKLARCYGSDSELKCEMMVLEDLIHDGFQLYNSNKPLDEQHIKLVLEGYAKFHAVSIAYRHHDFNGYKKMMNSITLMYPLFGQSETMKIMVNGVDNAKEFLEVGTKVHEAYSKFCDTVPDLWKKYTFDEYAVLMHGDCWCNNFMFKYENDGGKVSDVRFVDFQITGPASVVHDLSYFLMANSPQHVLKNLDEYLKFYYDNLATSLRDMSCPPEEVFSYKMFQDQWLKYCKHGLMMGITALKIATAAPDETPDLANDFDNFVNFVGTNFGEFKKRSLDIISYYYDNGFI